MTTIHFFNLFANATFSFWIGMMIVLSATHVFRIPTGPWKLSLLILPFVKVVFDFLNGVPSNSILMQNIDPFKIQPGMQSVSLGLGVDYWGPVLQLMFLVRTPEQKLYGASAGDYIYFWLQRKMELLPTFLLALASFVSLFLIARRVSEAIHFERIRRKDRILSKSLQSIPLFGRVVDIYISSSFIGTPFTGGLLKPYICFPQSTYHRLTPEEITAVIAHETAHIRQFDILFTLFVQILGDVFWFIPGYRLSSRKIDRMRELIADQLAVQSGVAAEQLASALLKLQEIPDVKNRYILYSAFTREGSLLKQRILRLLGEQRDQPSRLGWNRWLVRAVLSIWIAGATLNSTLAGNNRNSLQDPLEAYEKVKKYFQQKALGR